VDGGEGQLGRWGEAESLETAAEHKWSLWENISLSIYCEPGLVMMVRNLDDSWRSLKITSAIMTEKLIKRATFTAESEWRSSETQRSSDGY
jgi:hypothetical protein